MPLQEWQPGVGFGLTLIASAIIMFLSVARPESQVHCGCLHQPLWSNDLPAGAAVSWCSVDRGSLTSCGQWMSRCLSAQLLAQNFSPQSFLQADARTIRCACKLPTPQASAAVHRHLDTSFHACMRGFPGLGRME